MALLHFCCSFSLGPIRSRFVQFFLVLSCSLSLCPRLFRFVSFCISLSCFLDLPRSFLFGLLLSCFVLCFFVCTFFPFSFCPVLSGRVTFCLVSSRSFSSCPALCHFVSFFLVASRSCSSSFVLFRFVPVCLCLSPVISLFVFSLRFLFSNFVSRFHVLSCSFSICPVLSHFMLFLRVLS